jgi:hypothetical protein
MMNQAKIIQYYKVLTDFLLYCVLSIWTSSSQPFGAPCVIGIVILFCGSLELEQKLKFMMLRVF